MLSPNDPGSKDKTAFNLGTGESIETSLKAIAFESTTGVKEIKNKAIKL